jgi:hypothetical protein
MSMDIRPSLQLVQNDLVQLVEGTIAGRENASIMVLGGSGVGKTLVSSDTALYGLKTSSRSPKGWYFQPEYALSRHSASGNSKNIALPAS